MKSFNSVLLCMIKIFIFLMTSCNLVPVIDSQSTSSQDHTHSTTVTTTRPATSTTTICSDPSMENGRRDWWKTFVQRTNMKNIFSAVSYMFKGVTFVKTSSTYVTSSADHARSATEIATTSSTMEASMQTNLSTKNGWRGRWKTFMKAMKMKLTTPPRRFRGQSGENKADTGVLIHGEDFNTPAPKFSLASRLLSQVKTCKRLHSGSIYKEGHRGSEDGHMTLDSDCSAVSPRINVASNSSPRTASTISSSPWKILLLLEDEVRNLWKSMDHLIRRIEIKMEIKKSDFQISELEIMIDLEKEKIREDGVEVINNKPSLLDSLEREMKMFIADHLQVKMGFLKVKNDMEVTMKDLYAIGESIEKKSSRNCDEQNAVELLLNEIDRKLSDAMEEINKLKSSFRLHYELEDEVQLTKEENGSAESKFDDVENKPTTSPPIYLPPSQKRWKKFGRAVTNKTMKLGHRLAKPWPKDVEGNAARMHQFSATKRLHQLKSFCKSSRRLKTKKHTLRELLQLEAKEPTVMPGIESQHSCEGDGFPSTPSTPEMVLHRDQAYEEEELKSGNKHCIASKRKTSTYSLRHKLFWVLRKKSRKRQFEENFSPEIPPRLRQLLSNDDTGNVGSSFGHQQIEAEEILVSYRMKRMSEKRGYETKIYIEECEVAKAKFLKLKDEAQELKNDFGRLMKSIKEFEANLRPI